jgi:VIT1/CCC1 family predicted Fe2+/Mn2+ transporter
LLTAASDSDPTVPESPVALSQADTDVEAQQQGAEEDAGDEEHHERRLNPRVISDAIIGLSDGLTVPFALTAGLSGLGDTRVVVLGGLAELIAGAISMGLGGFIGAKSEAYVCFCHWSDAPDPC